MSWYPYLHACHKEYWSVELQAVVIVTAEALAKALRASVTKIPRAFFRPLCGLGSTPRFTRCNIRNETCAVPLWNRQQSALVETWFLCSDYWERSSEICVRNKIRESILEHASHLYLHTKILPAHSGQLLQVVNHVHFMFHPVLWEAHHDSQPMKITILILHFWSLV